MPINPVATVFDIPLLQDAISAHLTAKDLKRCLLVCQAWRNSFRPHLFRVVIVNSRTASSKLKATTMQALLTQHAHMIRVIDCGTLDWPFPDNVAMRNVTVLRMPYSNSKVAPMLEALPWLRDLELFPLGSSPDSLVGVLSAISSHAHLRSVKLVCAPHPNPTRLGWILWSLARLERISLSVTIYEHDSAVLAAEQQQLDRIMATAPSCPAVKELDLESVFFNFDHTVLVSFLLQCHHLESFSLPNITHNASTPNYAVIFTAAKARIQHLDAHRARLSSADMAVMINACVGLRKFRVALGQFGPHSAVKSPQSVVDALLEHRETLQDVDLTDAGMDEWTGAMLQSLLRVCPRLRSFVAMRPLNKDHPIMDRHCDPVLGASDLVVPGGRRLDWACVDLKKLSIRFMPSVEIAADQVERGSAKHVAVIPRGLVEQVRRLSKLEDLRLGYVARAKAIESVGAVDSMEPDGQTVSEAVADLATLDRIKRLELRNLKRFNIETVFNVPLLQDAISVNLETNGPPLLHLDLPRVARSFRTLALSCD
ncbi:hypothetical protein BGZ52_004078 [Haplosporangium bisporale]|nr:hypothetical protein BGZ52_004078 [Haplosporangium bisporale]KAF9212895.1 hypothetical protein BGZ59_006194 [Podila verticillata]